MKSKKLKLSSINIKSRWKRSEFPKINIAGKWLEENGFQIGDQVHVQYAPGQITITKSKEP